MACKYFEMLLCLYSLALIMMEIIKLQDKIKPLMIMDVKIHCPN